MVEGKPSAADEPVSEDELKQRLQALLAAGLSRTQASRQLAQETQGNCTLDKCQYPVF